MKQTTIDASLLPHVWLNWTTKKGTHYLDCNTGKKSDTPPDISFGWKNKDEILLAANSRPMRAYVKYHEDIEMLELAAVTIDTTRKEVPHEWRYTGTKIFIGKDKCALDENGAMIHSATVYPYHTGYTISNAINIISRLSHNPKNISEFHKFLGSTYYTIGNGRTIDVTSFWHIQDWYDKKQPVGTTNKGKAGKLVDKLIAIPLSDCSDLGSKYAPIQIDQYSVAKNIIYYERANEDWSVLRMFRRDINDDVTEAERMYLSDKGENRVAILTKNGWIPSRQFTDYNYYQFVNKDEAMEKCPRLKYVITLCESNNMSGASSIKNYLKRMLQFPEIEQIIKLGYTTCARNILDSSTPKAYMKELFGEYYNEKGKTLLQKAGMTKYQFDSMMRHYESSRYHYNKYFVKMREYFGDDLIHLDNATFDRYCNAFATINRNCWRFYENITHINVDYKKFMRNVVRIGEKNFTAYQVLNDTMNRYLGLSTGTEPEIDWYFDSYSDLVRTHNAVDELYRQQQAERRAMWNVAEAERLKKQEERRVKIDKERKKLEYEDDNYIIRLPENGTEITNEGQLQRICIGGYVGRHSMGDCTLFFLREKKNPDVPFYAIEVNKLNAIVQIHGYCNQWLGNNPEAIPTVVRWLRQNGIQCSKEILTCKSKGYCSTREYVPMPKVD